MCGLCFPKEVESFFKLAVPSLTNSLGCVYCPGGIGSRWGGRGGRLNLYSFLRQPAITRLDRYIAAT